MTVLTIESSSLRDAEQELESLSASLKESLERFPSLGLKLKQLLLTSSDEIQPGLIELGVSMADGAGGLTITANLTDRLREIVAAAAAGDLEGLRINE